jgi:hypothetical protein
LTPTFGIVSRSASRKSGGSAGGFDGDHDVADHRVLKEAATDGLTARALVHTLKPIFDSLEGVSGSLNLVGIAGS